LAKQERRGLAWIVSTFSTYKTNELKDKFMSSEMRQNSRAAMYKFKNFQGEDPKPPRFKVRGKEEGAGAGRKKGGGTGRGRWGGRGREERMGEGRRGGGDYVSPRPE